MPPRLTKHAIEALHNAEILPTPLAEDQMDLWCAAVRMCKSVGWDRAPTCVPGEPRGAIYIKTTALLQTDCHSGEIPWR
jgi:hypothetical protein